MNFDEQMMRRCIQLAENGLGTTYPNPMVGCVIVHDGKIIGEGWHRKAGESHAEVNAVNSIKDKELLKNSTIYVSLEPCSHIGKTPPCADLITSLNIPRAVIGMNDPNEKVNGRGITKMKEAGVEVTSGILEKECRELNKRFLSYHQNKRPYIILKWAQTADGFTGTLSGEQKWITNPYSKQLVHRWRTEEQSILVGTRTAEFDNPNLNARLWEGPQPLRLVIDRNLRLSPDLNLFNGELPTLVFTEKEKGDKENLEYIKCDFSDNLEEDILKELYKKGIQSLIIEGGSSTLQRFINKGFWDEARVFTSKESWGRGVKSPDFEGYITDMIMIDNDRLEIFRR